MLKLAAIMKYAQYVPFVLDTVKGLRKQEQPSPQAAETREMLVDFKKDVLERLNTLEEDNARLKARMREAQSSLDFYRVFVWLFGAFSSVFAIIAIIVAMSALNR